MSLTHTERAILTTDGEIALAELLAGEQELIEASSDQTYYDDPDDRPVPFHLARHRLDHRHQPAPGRDRARPEQRRGPAAGPAPVRHHRTGPDPGRHRR